jgi:murein DD-endopeptidase MepM/ murein hydrolase activator NlpD
MRSVRRGAVRRAVRAALPLGLLLVAAVLASTAGHLDAYSASPFPLVPTLPYDEALDRLGAVADLDVSGVVPAPVPVEGTFQRGETLTGVFQGLGLDASDALLAVSALSQHLDVRKVRAGDAYAALYGIDTHRIESVEVPVPGVGRAVAVRTDGGWEGRFRPFERRLVPLTVRGVVEGSLISAVAAAGATPQLAYRMADVLQWDLDFSRDLRRGDTFEVAFDAVELDGRPAGLGEIWALTFDNGGRRLEAYRYGGDYYDGDGRPLEKMFLRSPLQYAFVTSGFNPRRLHPVLKTYRPHWGVDYRAKVGTPVRVTANGVVTFAGWSNGGGKMVKVRHPNGYVTAYLHLSRFASGIRPGTRVGQGDVVAYSGNTGLSTAPHLDYRVQRDGRWINPLQLDNVPAEPIPADQRAGFLAFRDTCRRSLADGAPLPLRPQEDADGGVQMASLAGAETARAADGPASSGR